MDGRIAHLMVRRAESAQGLHAQLADARSRNVRVRIQRDIEAADALFGFVVDMSQEWVLLAQYDSNWFAYDGFEAIRARDISDVELVGSANSVDVRALRMADSWPPPEPPGLALTGTAELVRTGTQQFGVVSVHTEHLAADVCYVGSVMSIDEQNVILRSLDPEAIWEKEPERFSLEDITRVTLGDRYAQTLLRLSEPEPVPEA